MTSRRKSESGQVVVLAAGAMLVIIGMAALAVDVGSLYATRRNMQTAADAAAIAGANALETTCGTNAGCTCESEAACASAAQDVATLNGYAGGVTVKTPATKPNPANGVYVQVDVTQAVPTYFMGALGLSTVSVKTTAVAGYAPTPNCMFIRDPNNDPDTLVVSGGNSKISADCGILDESSNSKGMDVSGGASVEVSSIGIAASSYTGTSGGSTVTCNGTTANCPQTKVAPSTDPLGYLDSEEPTPGTCATGTDLLNATSGNGGAIHPGTYCTGIKVSNSGHTITLNPGLYILTGNNGLNVSGGATISGSGVTIYNSGTGKVDISGGSTVNLTAPIDSSAGGIPSVLIFQDPANTAAATFSGGSTGNIQGDLYFPTATMFTFSGGSSTNPQDVVLDAWKMTISGGSAFLSAPGAAAGGGPPITVSRLYE